MEKEENFFKKILISISKFEKYSILATKDGKIVFSYFIKLILILTIISSFALIYAIKTKDGLNLLDSSGQTINVSDMAQSILQKYEEINPIIVYVEIFLVFYINIFIFYFISTSIDIILLGAFGYFTAIILRLKLRFSVMCKIATFALTLPIFLKIICLLAQIFANFQVKYFQLMYVSIAYIYIVVAILMIKSDIISNQKELIKIIEEQERVKKQFEQEKQQEKKKINKEDEQEKKDEQEEPQPDEG